MILKNALFFSLFVLLSWNTYAQDTFKGKIVAKPWSKTSESYCARGSNYYVLELQDQSAIVIKDNKSLNLSKWKGKLVEIKGKIETREVKPSNPMEQRPVNIDINGKEIPFTCSVLDIQEIKAVKIVKNKN